MALWLCTYNCDTSITITGTPTFQTIIQVATVITSVLSLCYGFVSWRQMLEGETENEDRTWKGMAVDMAVDMVWNLLSVSPRVIALALFASFELYWFWGLMITQLVIISISFCLFLCCTNQFIGIGFIQLLQMNFFMGMGPIFTMF